MKTMSSFNQLWERLVCRIIQTENLKLVTLCETMFYMDIAGLNYILFVN